MCIYTTFYLSIHLPMDLLVDSMPWNSMHWLLWIVLQQTCEFIIDGLEGEGNGWEWKWGSKDRRKERKMSQRSSSWENGILHWVNNIKRESLFFSNYSSPLCLWKIYCKTPHTEPKTANNTKAYIDRYIDR